MLRATSINQFAVRAMALALFLIGGEALLPAQPFSFGTLAGLPGTPGSVDGTGSAAQFYNPNGVAVDAGGNVFVADEGNNIIRKITPGGVTTTFAGTTGQTGSSDGTGTAALFSSPNGIAIDAADNLYVADSNNNTIRMITPAGAVTTVAGSAGQIGTTDGTGTAAQFNCPFAVAVDATGNIYVADTYNFTIRKIAPGGAVTTLAGLAGTSGSTDGPGSSARFNYPFGIAVDVAGNVYVSDTLNNTIRKITPGGMVSTLAGTPGQSGFADGTGSAALFNQPFGVTVDGAGNIYVGDYANNAVRKISPAGLVSTLSNGTAQFNYPSGVAVDPTGNLYVADSSNDTVRMGAPTDLLSGAPVGSGIKLSPWFGYYSYQYYPLVYGFNVGWEYLFDSGEGGLFLYDFASGHFWYTQSSYYPFVYDFSDNTFLYYFTNNAAGAPRYFYSYGTPPGYITQ